MGKHEDSGSAQMAIERVPSDTAYGKSIIVWRSIGIAVALIGSPVAAVMAGVNGFVGCFLGGFLILEACPRVEVYDQELDTK